MNKRDKCVTDGCDERKEYSVVFGDGCKDKYCKDCTGHFQFWDSKNGFYGLKSVKPLEVKKEVGS